jgi:hypothetical protein
MFNGLRGRIGIRVANAFVIYPQRLKARLTLSDDGGMA